MKKKNLDCLVLCMRFECQIQKSSFKKNIRRSFINVLNVWNRHFLYSDLFPNMNTEQKLSNWFLEKENSRNVGVVESWNYKLFVRKKIQFRYWKISSGKERSQNSYDYGSSCYSHSFFLESFAQLSSHHHEAMKKPL